MAVAGIQNVSVLDPSFLRESQSQAPRQISEEGRVSTPASSLLRMWRELEDEHVVSRAQERFRERLFHQRNDGCIADRSRTDSSESHGSEHSGDSEDLSVGENERSTWSEGQNGPNNDYEVSSSYNSEHSSDFGEVERGRVRQVSREWMNSSGGECTSNIPQINDRLKTEWLGETEQERVRVIRECVQMNSQRRGTCGGSRESHTPELGSQIERVREEVVVNQNEGRNQHVRRGIRKLCGRQALLDMVRKAERERKMEVQGLLEHRAVTNFPHRNRIQSLLRGWFLRNGRVTGNERPSSIAERELGLLRQKPSVSGLREEFFSRLDNSASAHASSSSSSDISNEDTNLIRDKEIQVNNTYEVINDLCEQSEFNYEGSDDQVHESRGTFHGRNESGGNTVECIDSEESNPDIVEGWRERVQGNSPEREWQWSTNPELVERREGTEQQTGMDSLDNTSNEQARDASQDGAREQRIVGESGYATNDQSESSREANDFPGSSGSPNNSDGNTTNNVSRQESGSEVQHWPDQSSETEERDWEQDVAEYTEWRGSIDENAAGNQQQSAGFEWSLADEERENSQLDEAPEEWHEEGGFQEAVQSWLEGPSLEAVPERVVENTYYLPDDDNVYSVELRELLSRRRVSNLLHSGFRESLNQLIQSYVERQGNAAVDWQGDGSPPPESADEVQDQPSANHDETRVDPVPVSILLPPIPSPPTWDRESHHDNWTPHDMHQRLGIEWDIINDMRIDMARLQQKMNNLQRMLETCMDMQLELQRSIRQEVSAALNRSASSAGSEGLSEVGLPCDDAKWDHVRKGICCVCCDNNIDSLLYRCGHMCTCAKCANGLIESRGNCPMCRAPVVEVIRAYSIL